MREVVFIKKNRKKWQKVEDLLYAGGSASPDELADLFIELNDDLAYAKTNYPESKSTEYLNGLTTSIYRKLNRKGYFSWNRIANFWVRDLPLEIARAHKYFLIAFIIFTVSTLIGVISTSYDTNFPRLILGDQYINMTLENIEKGDPMAVYKDDMKDYMFLRITINNIRVAILTFSLGAFFSLGTYWLMFKNGVMLGTFQWFFYTKGLLLPSFLTIWIHGTIEISCIIIAGAAGILMGNSFLYPGTFKRKTALIIGARRGLNIMIGIIPLIILAAIFESYVTRYTEWSSFAKGMVIFLSLAFVLFYFVFYPRYLLKKMSLSPDLERIHESAY